MKKAINPFGFFIPGAWARVNLKSFLIPVIPGCLKPFWERIERSPLGYRMAKGAFWSLAGTVISRLLNLVASILVARQLGQVGFGELGTIQSTVGLFGVFAGFGLGLMAIKHVAEFKAKDPARAGRIIRLSSLVSWFSGGLLTVLMVSTGPWLASKTLAAPQLGWPLQLSSLLLLLGAVNGAQTGALAGFEAFKRIAWINVVAGAVSLPLVVGGAWWRGLDGAILGLVASQAVNCVLNYQGLRAEAALAGVTLKCVGSWSESAALWRFSLPAIASSSMVGPVYWLCNALLVNQPDGYAQMGLFNAANQWFNALLFLPGILSQTVLPILSERIGANDDVDVSRILGYCIKLNAAVVAPLVAIGSLASSYIMASYGKEYADAWPLLVVVFATAGILAVQSTVGQILIASNRLWLGTVMNMGWALGFLISAFFLVPYGSLGLAWARLIAYLLHAVWTFGFAIHFLNRLKAASLNIHEKSR